MPVQIPREIPYNYTSCDDRDIVTRFLGTTAWQLITELRTERQTGNSARMLFELLGDMWVVTRNPFIQDDLITNFKRWRSLKNALLQRLEMITQRANSNEKVLALMEKAHAAIDSFNDNLQQQKLLRRKILHKLSKLTRKDNICFDGLSRVAHATDATDWRVEYPLVVIKPDQENEIPFIIKACIELGLSIVPRGGGTGYTGGAIPLTPLSAVVNTEKLQKLGNIEMQTLPETKQTMATIRAEAGVVTRRVADAAKLQNLVFAVDPTSQDASTIGGNIATNAGGKKAVLWGCTLDNLVSWRMVMPNGTWLHVERLRHNCGKIHQQPMVEFRIHRFAADHKTAIAEEQILKIPGATLRKQGLGKDVTDKFLAGLPGMQKEGCDGLITSATFILHQAPQHTRTICLEFFGNNVRQAVTAIIKIKNLVEAKTDVLLSGLEHMDERYVKAVKYATKASRSERPKMVLLADIVGNDEITLQQTATEIVRLANLFDGEGFIAVSAEARHRFWLDRARTAAIAAHTNAFKINEDVVIPLENLAAYNDAIERINIEQSLQNKILCITHLKEYIHQLRQQQPDKKEANAIFSDKLAAADQLLYEVQDNWQTMLDNLDVSANDIPTLTLDSQDSLFHLLQKRSVRVSYHQSIEKPLFKIFSGEGNQAIRDSIKKIHQRVLQKRLFVALHMHAGDGNVHTNIPVNSNDTEMLQAAEKIVVRIMAIAKSLDGVISGEHGIGITKMPFLDSETIAAFKRYKASIDPQGNFNKGKLLSNIGLQNAYTPSLRLLQQEALLLEASELGQLNDATKNCLRCGKCKPVCMTHIPQANMYYSPRDKILGTGALIEAFLYEEQTRRGISLQYFAQFNDIADHCTTCHKCFDPCPVNIDFGDVSIRMRNILRQRGQKKFSLSTRLALWFLNTTNPLTIKLLRASLIKLGFRVQRLFNNIYRGIKKSRTTLPASTTGKTPVKEQVIYFVNRPMPAAVPSKTARALIGAEDSKTIAIIRDPRKINSNSDAVFYFPGCGSERLFSQIGLATFAMLHHIGVQTVLPPGYLCCGYPQTAAGDIKKGEQISVANRVLFHRMANTLNYLDIKTIVVSCGTCIDQLAKYQLEKIFPGARLLDIHEYLMEKQVHTNTGDAQYLYHDPCHSPMKIYDPEKVAGNLLGKPITSSKFCCGDAGTLSVSRPDIGNQLKFRKENEIKKNIKTLTGKEKSRDVTMLTSCPACIKGLASYTKSTGIKTDYIVVELARQLLGKHWQNDFVNNIKHGSVESILL